LSTVKCVDDRDIERGSWTGVGTGLGIGLAGGLVDVPPVGVGLWPGVAPADGLAPGAVEGVAPGEGVANVTGASTCSVADKRQDAFQQSLTV
jgi:hypothetical protein